MQNCVRKKRPENTSGGPSGDPFWDPKSPKIDVGGTKIAKISGKSRFLDRPFFDRFFEHGKKQKKTEKRRFWDGRLSERRSPQSPAER